MKPTTYILPLYILICSLYSNLTFGQEAKRDTALCDSIPPFLLGKWIKHTDRGIILLNFKKGGIVEGDFGNNNSIDFVAIYKTDSSTISFTNTDDGRCIETGLYTLKGNDYYMAFDLIKDKCGRRIKSIMGFWVKKDHANLLKELSQKIVDSSKPEDHINRAVMFIALNRPKRAQHDLDIVIQSDKPGSDAYIMRAGTRLSSNDLQGVIADCNQALKLEPDNMKAYYFRGQAYYKLGKEEKACEDFYKAIELGFIAVRFYERQKCAEYWKNMEKH